MLAKISILFDAHNYECNKSYPTFSKVLDSVKITCSAHWVRRAKSSLKFTIRKLASPRFWFVLWQRGQIVLVPIDDGHCWNLLTDGQVKFFPSLQSFDEGKRIFQSFVAFHKQFVYIFYCLNYKNIQFGFDQIAKVK